LWLSEAFFLYFRKVKLIDLYKIYKQSKDLSELSFNKATISIQNPIRPALMIEGTR
jgi:hypothetical protein